MGPRTRRSTTLGVVVGLAAAMLPVTAATAAPTPPDVTPVTSTAPVPPPAELRIETVPGPEGCVPVLDGPVAGEEAITELGRQLAEVADDYDRSAAELRRDLRTDETLHVDGCGRLVFIDTLARHAHVDTDAHGHAGADAHASTRAVPDADPPAPLAETFALESRPGSQRTIHLDFDGHTLSGTAWNQQWGLPQGTVLAPYSIDADPGFSDAELAIIQSVWQHVAEDFAAFDVNVTTRDPGAAAIDRAGPSDQVYGTRAVVTNTPAFCAPCVGIAYLDVFASSQDHALTQPALIFASAFPGTQGREPQLLADTISHEVGHNLGLRHHGDTRQGGASEYARGRGLWGPLMGATLYPLTTWSVGDYAGATNPSQDDVARIARGGVPRLGGDHGDTAATATPLPALPVTTTGVIETRTDTDWFRFTAAGPTTIAARPTPVGPNLDLELQVVTSGGQVLATVDPASSWPYFDAAPFVQFDTAVSGLDAEVTLDLPAGTYLARVRGVGAGDPQVNGYSDYGSLGDYTLAVGAAGVVPPPPGPRPVVTITAGPSGATNVTSAEFRFTSAPSGASFECRVNTAAWTACTSPRTVTGLGQGTQTFQVRGTVAGVTSAPRQRTLEIDTVAPVVTITGTPEAGARTTATTASFRFRADEPVQGNRFECRIVAGSNTASYRDCGQGVDVGGLSAGTWRIDVRATDLAGNVGSTSRSWTVGATTSTPPPPTSPPPSGTPSFSDVTAGSTHAAAIGELARRGVTLGCGGGRFCPDDAVTREQMATFLVRALELRAGSPSPPFSDVTAGSTHARSIDAMRRDGITVGCGGGRFCPRAPVPREQMASFLTRALGLPPGSASPPFSDVVAGSTHARNIDAVRRQAITLGCGGGRFCPSAPVTRAQMASFLVRALEW